MKNKLQKLPIDQSSFEIIREDNLLYVDKTRYIHEMLETGRYFFMSRPRRFGKSLMVSALKCFFRNRKELFDGLWIAEHGDWKWEEYPVIVFDFNQISHNDPDEFRAGLERTLLLTAQQYGVSSDAPFLKGKFAELILKLRRKTGKPVVILADEYDRPVIDHLGKGDNFLKTAGINRDILMDFLVTMKGGDLVPHIRFFFMTGITNLSRASAFSGLNFLTDMTLNRKYAAISGFTQEELGNRLSGHIAQYAEKSGMTVLQFIMELERRFGGYRFSEKNVRVICPAPVFNVLCDSAFGSSPEHDSMLTFSVTLLRERDYSLPELERFYVSEHIFSMYEPEHLCPEVLLFHIGCLTVKEVDERLWTLGYPNLEVKCSFLKHLLYSFTRELDGTQRSRFLLLAEYLEAEDYKAFFETVNAIFASVSHTLKTERNEAYFHTLFYLMVSASGSSVQSEVLTSRGRIDMVVEFADKIFVMEFKCGHSAQAALKQIHEKGYADMYAKKGKKRILMGINFSTEKRAADEWKHEILPDVT